MRRDFLITRIFLVLVAVVLGLALLLQLLPTPKKPVPTRDQERPPSQASIAPSWEEQLSSPEIKSFWQERRLQLDSLSQAYLDEPDSSRREALRRELERLIEESELEITALRHQKQGGIP